MKPGRVGNAYLWREQMRPCWTLTLAHTHLSPPPTPPLAEWLQAWAWLPPSLKPSLEWYIPNFPNFASCQAKGKAALLMRDNPQAAQTLPCLQLCSPSSGSLFKTSMIQPDAKLSDLIGVLLSRQKRTRLGLGLGHTLLRSMEILQTP